MDEYFTPEGYRKYWENCENRQAHLWTDKTEFYPRRWNTWLPWFDFREKVVIDYGCGGAFIYNVLKSNISKYIGIDIADRSLEFAKERLKEESKCTFLKAPCELSGLGASILICQQVISHMAYQEMLDQFLTSIRQSEVQELMLEVIFHPDKNVVEFGGRTIHDACSIGKNYIARMTGFEMVKEEKVDQYSFTKWQRIEEPKEEPKPEFLREEMESIVDQASKGITNVEQAAIRELADLGSLVKRIINK